MRRAVTGVALVCVACGTAGSPAADTGTTGTAATTTSTATTTATTTTAASTTTTSGPLDTSTTDDTVADTTTASVPDAVALYVSSGTVVHGFDVDLATGLLTAHRPIDLGTNIGAMTHDAARARLLVAVTNDEAIASYGIAADGVLAAVDQVGVEMNPVYLSLSEAGPHVLVADFGGNDVGSFGIDGGGAVVAGAITSLAVDEQPHSIVLAPDRRFAFVPHLGGNVIVQLGFDATTGVLTPHVPTDGEPPANAGPRHMIFAADARVAWVVNEIGDSVTTWAYDAAAGQLSAPQTISTLPEGVDGSDNTGADVHVTPDGRFVYTSNRGHDTLAIFAVQGDGSLVAMGHVATEPHVRDFAIEPTGAFLYAAGRDSGLLASYAIGKDGMLTPITTTPVPPSPTWVEPVALPR